MIFIFVAFIICIIARVKIFWDRQEKGWKALIPFYNKYVLGKIIDNKKIGIIVSIFEFLFIGIISLCIYIEYIILEKIPYTITDIDNFNLTDYVPQSLLTSNSIFKILLIIIAVLYFISWVILTYKFSDKQNSNTWWMLAWAIIPVVPYIHYAYIYKTVYIPNKGLIQFQKTEVRVEKEPKRRERRNVNK